MPSNHFFDLPWSRRLWTIQECVLIPNVVLVCGRSEISIVKLIAGLRRLMLSDVWPEVIERPGARSMLRVADLWSSICSTNQALLGLSTLSSSTYSLTPLDIVGLVD